ncbi:MAG TPA: MCE family protein [Actinomycetota bacterium]|nr:MCE family protein [Actinomycetota bacterium]
MRVNLVAFFVISMGLVYAMATQVLTVLQGRYSIDAIFPDAGGVFTNQEVTYRGNAVGQVGEMTVVPEGVKLELIIKEEFKIPAEDVEARVMFKSAVGEQFVDILPATEGEPYLEQGDEIPIGQTSIPVSTQALLSTTQSVLEGVPPEALAGAINSLAEGLAGEGSDIALLLESMADLSDLFAARAPEVVGILENGTQVGDAFLRSKDDFAAAIHDLIIVAETLADNRGNLDRLLNGANLLSDELVQLIRENRDVLNQVIEDLADINEFQADRAAAISDLIEKLPVGLARVVKTFESKTGLVRFGLVQDTNNPACDYSNVNRRPPQDRSPRLPPKNAHCAGAVEPAGSNDTGSGEPPADSPPAESPLGNEGGTDLNNLLLPDAGDSSQQLPERLEHMGWMFFYLNGLR